jgi:hypothetical protein
VLGYGEKMGDIISQEFFLEGRMITTVSGGITGPRAPLWEKPDG